MDLIVYFKDVFVFSIYKSVFDEYFVNNIDYDDKNSLDEFDKLNIAYKNGEKSIFINEKEYYYKTSEEEKELGDGYVPAIIINKLIKGFAETIGVDVGMEIFNALGINADKMNEIYNSVLSQTTDEDKVC
jgi:hypothetical protein